ncbi:MAG TPA: MGMT family protein [Clostridia bacterium]|nr:MGMT family protein [Clostridia bacterium]
MSILPFTLYTDAGWVSGLVTEAGLAALSLPMPTREEAIRDAAMASFRSSRIEPATAASADRKAFTVEGDSSDLSRLRLLAEQVKEWVSRYLKKSESGEPACCPVSSPDFPLDLNGMTSFRKAVLLAMANIPYGMVSSYSGLAKAAGYPGCARAVGGVCAANPIPLVIPCHRVILSDGRIGNFGGGKEMKKWLLEREGVALERRADDWIVRALRFWTFR